VRLDVVLLRELVLLFRELISLLLRHFSASFGRG
jgi:hypothetical protein